MTTQETRGDSLVEGILFRTPVLTDGKAVHELILHSPPLDINSSYCYFLLCSHYAETCVVAEQQGNLAGFISAYLLPQQPDTLFIWQMAVGQDWRGHGIAGRMLRELLQRSACGSVQFLETTVSPSNEASRQVFRRFADARLAAWQERPFLRREHFSDESHEEEVLIRIGPFDAVR